MTRGGRRLLAAVVASAALTGAAGCGGGDDATSDDASGPITVETFCDDYLKHPDADRLAAAQQISRDLGVPQGGDASWQQALDQRCGEAPDLKVGDFFHHFT